MKQKFIFYLLFVLGLLYIFPNVFSIANVSYRTIQKNFVIYEVIDENVNKI